MVLKRDVDTCPHVPEKDLPPLGQAERYLDRAESLTSAAAALLDRTAHDELAREAWARADELLNEADDRVTEFDSVVAAGEWHGAEAAAAERDAREILNAQGVPSFEAQPDGLLSQADRAVSDAESNLRSVIRPSASVSLSRRAVEIRRRVAAVRDRLWQAENRQV